MYNTTTYISPSQSIIDKESEHILLSYCSFCTLVRGKKLSFQNVFVLTLENESMKNILKNLLGVDSDHELFKIFLDYDPTITKSKYITKFINNKKRACR